MTSYGALFDVAFPENEKKFLWLFIRGSFKSWPEEGRGHKFKIEEFGVYGKYVFYIPHTYVIVQTECKSGVLGAGCKYLLDNSMSLDENDSLKIIEIIREFLEDARSPVIVDVSEISRDRVLRKFIPSTNKHKDSCKKYVSFLGTAKEAYVINVVDMIKPKRHEPGEKLHDEFKEVERLQIFRLYPTLIKRCEDVTPEIWLLEHENIES